jgi:acyl carrier protein
MKDLTKTTPRSAGETMLGIVQLARTIDKAKALTHGTIGEYKYDCPMDQSLFEYLDMDSKAFLELVNNAKSDYEIEAYAKRFVSRKDPRNIEAFNKKFLSAVPTGESLTHFEELRSEIAPSRTDVVSWSDLLDLEEGRTVPHRELARA